MKRDTSTAATNSLVSRRRFLALAGIGTGLALGHTLIACSPVSSNSTVRPVDTSFSNAELSDLLLDETAQLELKIDLLIEGMTLEQKIAQLFIVRPEELAGFEAMTQATEHLLELQKQCPVGGFIYFDDNLLDATQTQTMLSATLAGGLAANGIPPFLCVDEEGGTVLRVGGSWNFDVPYVGDMRDVGATGDTAYAKDVATTLANYLTPLGFNTDFAPVCDIASNPSGDMTYRSFGSDPELVAQMAQAQIEGFLEQGVLCSAKHFPGIGAAVGDSHFGMITTNATLEELYTLELIPFQRAIATGVPFVMVGHISVPAVVGDYTPASLSPRIITELLREELSYDGLIITDGLDMGAICDYYGAREATMLAFLAGCDVLLLSGNFWESLGDMLDAVANGTLSEERVNQSVRRILRTKLNHLGDLFSDAS